MGPHKFEKGRTGTTPQMQYCQCVHCGLHANVAVILDIAGPECGKCPGMWEPTLELLLETLKLRHSLYAARLGEPLHWQETFCGPMAGFVCAGRHDNGLVVYPQSTATRKIFTQSASGVWIPEQGCPITWHKDGIAPNGFGPTSIPSHGETRVILPFHPAEGRLEIREISGWYFRLPQPE